MTNGEQREVNDERHKPTFITGRWSLVRIKAFLVHIYTASTVVFLLISTHFLLQDQLTAALFVMLLAIVIDATDGTLARRWRVKEVVPEFDGRRLDDIIDYLSFVFLPVVFMLKAGMLLYPAVFFGALPLFASAFGFARVHAKLDDEGFFLGFPSYWNILVAYLYLMDTAPWINTVLVILLSVMVFVPTRYIYITRFPHLKWLNYAGSWLSGLLIFAALLTSGPLRLLLVALSLIFPIYYIIYSFLLDWRARKMIR